MDIALRNDELETIKKIKPNMIIPICFSVVSIAPNLTILNFFMENPQNFKMIVIEALNIFLGVLMIISWVTYFNSMNNYKNILQEYSESCSDDRAD